MDGQSECARRELALARAAAAEATILVDKARQETAQIVFGWKQDPSSAWIAAGPVCDEGTEGKSGEGS